MTLVNYLHALRRHWIIILLLALFGAGVGYLVAHTLPDQYQSSASVMVIPAKGGTTGELVQGSNYVQNLVQTYTMVASSPLVLDRVINSLGLDLTATQLAANVSTESPLNTVIIQITVTQNEPRLAQEVANEVADQLAIAVAELSPTGEGNNPAVRIETIATAQLPPSPSYPNPRLFMLLGLGAGLVLGVLYALIRKLFGTRITSTAEVRDFVDTPVLGEIANSAERTPVPTMIRRNPKGRVAESLRNVVAALRFVDLEHSKRVLLISSAIEGEGKTSACLGISLTLAEVGSRVLYVEADLRRPKASEYTQLDGTVGLTTVLVGDRELKDAVQEWANPNLHVLLSGELPPNPAQLLSSERLPELLAQARETYDYVIVDSAPVIPVADSLWLTPVVDGTILVVMVNRTTQESLLRAIDIIGSSHTPVLGILANGVKGGTKSAYHDVEVSEKARRGRRPRRPRSVGTRASTPSSRV